MTAPTIKFVLILLLFSIHSIAATPAEWQGEYAITQETDGGEESWSSHLSVHDCSTKSCHFLFGSGSMQSECSADGDFKIKMKTHAEFSVAVVADEADGARGECLLAFDLRKNGKIFVDSKNIFKSKKDEEFGNPCNTLCGFQGARYFGVEIPKISDKAFFNPSFSCLNNKLSVTEKSICTSAKLASLDQELSDQVAKAKSDQPKAIAKLTTEQRAWLKSRDEKCSNSKETENCLEGAYQERSKQLKSAAAMGSASKN
jgi:uncharacterized protein YecT (DUF1311 family)